MTSVEEELKDKESPIIVLDTNLVKSYNLDTKKYEIVDESMTCRHCETFLRGFCPDKNLGVSPRYHCNKTKDKRK